MLTITPIKKIFDPGTSLQSAIEFLGRAGSQEITKILDNEFNAKVEIGGRDQ